MKNKLTYTLAFALTLLVGMAFTLNHPQTHTISGQITDITSGTALEGVTVKVISTGVSTLSDKEGKYSISVPGNNESLRYSLEGYVEQTLSTGRRQRIDVALASVSAKPDSTDALGAPTEVIEMEAADALYEEVVVTSMGHERNAKRSRGGGRARMGMGATSGAYMSAPPSPEPGIDYNTEEYDVIKENGFKTAVDDPLSTFSIDVDNASYSNLRRVVSNGGTPHKDMVRIEEMVNYFNYEYTDPKGEHPFSINTEISSAPWNPQHRLVHVGIQGKKLNYDELNPCNLVFLIDVSGSMSDRNKLPLLKSSLKLLLSKLSEKDKVSLVVYAGAAGLVLPATPATQKETIMAALDNLQAGGSTAGGAGIQLAYKVAKDNLIADGNNRVILCTDGDFNVGASSTAEMVRMIEEKRKEGIFLTIAGFGMGNYKDGRMEQISNAGNGNYYYIDNIREAEKVFVTDMRATLFTIAKDVKIQVEFNPEHVQAYRLIGYENRLLNKEDFNDDKKDAGELGAGHTVTALYEIIPVGVESSFVKSVDELKYQRDPRNDKKHNDELLTVKFRYKQPDGDTSILIEHPLKDEAVDIASTSDNFRWSAAVAEYGMLLRKSEFKNDASYEQVLALARGAKGKDANGYRQEFIQLVTSSSLLTE